MSSFREGRALHDTPIPLRRSLATFVRNYALLAEVKAREHGLNPERCALISPHHAHFRDRLETRKVLRLPQKKIRADAVQAYYRKRAASQEFRDNFLCTGCTEVMHKHTQRSATVRACMCPEKNRVPHATHGANGGSGPHATVTVRGGLPAWYEDLPFGTWDLRRCRRSGTLAQAERRSLNAQPHNPARAGTR